VGGAYACVYTERYAEKLEMIEVTLRFLLEDVSWELMLTTEIPMI
jgi:hypothetical protein